MSKGTVTVTCTVCGRTETKTTKKDSKNHIGETEVRNAKEATCGEKGYSGDTYCIACNKKISYGKNINATGKHQWKNATFDTPKTCTVCGKKEGKPLSRYTTFGHYPQSTSGNDNTPIEWLVLDVDTKSNKALLISRYALDCMPYDTSYMNVTWETCTLRKWLNSTFLNNAFTAEEKKAILTTTVDNSKGQGYYGTNGGRNTQDKVFLLSYAEAWKYFKNNEARMCQPTAYAVKQNAYQANNGNCIWWLRSPGNYSNCASDVNYDGSLDSDYAYCADASVRPAFWLNLDSANIY